MTNVNMLQTLIKAYTEPHRHYHTLDHITHMINTAVSWRCEMTEELLYAIWFHDVIYVPFEKDNEEKSVELFKKFYDDVIFPNRSDIDKECGYAEELSSRFDNEPSPWAMIDVTYAILSTKNHKPLNKLAKQLIDLDLAILAEPFWMEEQDMSDKYAKKWFCTTSGSVNFDYLYDQYLWKIRAEYDPIFEHDSLWNAGRKTWIESMLSRDKLFYTEEGAKLEKSARANLSRELKIYT